jgi:hypothetical protein
MRPRRIDANQVAIVEAFRKAGASVMHMHTLGKGCPDLAIGFGGLTMLVEVKDGSKPPSQQKLTSDEKEFFRTWTGGVRIVKDEKDVQLTLDTLSRWHEYIMKGLMNDLG